MVLVLVLEFVAVHRNGLDQYAKHVCTDHSIQIYIHCSLFFSYLCITLSKQWHMHSAQHLYMYVIVDWLDMHYT